MTKSRFNLRNGIAIAICLVGVTMFSGCGKDDDPKDNGVTSIELNEQTLSLYYVGQTKTLTAKVLPADATDNSVTWSSSNDAVASVENGVVTAKTFGNATITAKAGKQTATCAVKVSVPDENGVLINGVVWAKYNVNAFGIFAATSESTGMFYQYNRAKAWAATGGVSDWNNTPDESRNWEKANDPSPTGYRLPTRDEIRSLLATDKVTSEWIAQAGINGRKFTDVATGNSIFLPAAGMRDGSGVLIEVGEEAVYWSSQHSSSIAYGVHSLYFTILHASGVESFGGSCGFFVRPVAE